MEGKKLYIVIIVCMSLLVAFGAWVMIDSAIAYQNRPLVEFVTPARESTSFIPGWIEGLRA